MTRNVLNIFFLSLLTIVTILIGTSPAQGTPEQKLFHFTNQYRLEYGLNKLEWSAKVAKRAEAHTQKMAAQKRLFHSSGLCHTWGENIGLGLNMWSIFRAFVKSSEHRANLLGHWHRTGIGAIRTKKALWVTEEFCR